MSQRRGWGPVLSSAMSPLQRIVHWFAAISQCDLHSTTNILMIPELAAKCSEPFTPAEIDKATGKVGKESLGQMLYQRYHPGGIQAAERQDGRRKYRCHDRRRISERHSILAYRSVFGNGYVDDPCREHCPVQIPGGEDDSGAEESQCEDAVRRQLHPGSLRPADDRRIQGRRRSRGQVFSQSSNCGDVLYWLKNDAEFGKQAVFLDERDLEKTFDHNKPATWKPSMKELGAEGV